VGDELEILRAAEERFHAGAPSQALALLDDHARRFPHGVLAEERRASRILALCQLGQVALATSEADSFVAQYPASPFVERVRRACAR
jgi:outer membrane protein assembly factor BamD (BamD/ComL family)